MLLACSSKKKPKKPNYRKKTKTLVISPLGIMKGIGYSSYLVLSPLCHSINQALRFYCSNIRAIITGDLK